MAQTNLFSTFLKSCCALRGHVKRSKVLDLSDYKNIYLKTAKEYIESLRSNCSKLSANSQDKEAINAIHIASHSLKSQSQTMGFMDVTVLSGAIEKKSRDILTGVAQIDEEFIFFLKDFIEKLNLELLKIKKEMLK